VGKKPKKLEITKTVDTANRLKGKRKGAILKEEVWETDNGQVVKYVLAYINPRICGPDNGRVLGTTIGTITIIGTSWGLRNRWTSLTTKH